MKKQQIILDPFLMALVIIMILLGLLMVTGCSRSMGQEEIENLQTTSENLPRFEERKDTMADETDSKYPIPSREELKQKLTPQQYNVIVKKGTEPPFTHDYNDLKKNGVFDCAACGQPLFRSETKFDSGTGWPSFYQPAGDDNVEQVADKSLGMTRTEVVCGNCGAHLGHVFNDGPKPTGLRYCINGASLQFEPEDNAEKSED